VAGEPVVAEPVGVTAPPAALLALAAVLALGTVLAWGPGLSAGWDAWLLEELADVHPAVTAQAVATAHAAAYVRHLFLSRCTPRL
jgi:hypothetical protein